jgi:bifunctional DNase/RNase
MIEVNIFTVVVAHPEAPSVVVLAEKGLAPSLLSGAGARFGVGTSTGAAGGEVAASAGAGIGAGTGAGADGSGGCLPQEDGTPRDGLPQNRKAFDALGVEEPQLLPIWIGHSEAEAIMLLLEGRVHGRPLTHDLLASVINTLGATVERVVIDRVKGSTFYASIRLDRGGRPVHIDARPSDSIALALRTNVGIFVDEDVMNAAARQFKIKVSDGGELLYGSEAEMDRFHSFIESVSPEDFEHR